MSSYVWSVFEILANSTFRPYRKTSAALRSAMMFYKHERLAMQDSRYQHVQHRSLAGDVAVMHEASYVNGREKLLAADYAAYYDLFATTNKVMQVRAGTMV